jgi:hypothetical protein
MVARAARKKNIQTVLKMKIITREADILTVTRMSMKITEGATKTEVADKVSVVGLVILKDIRRWRKEDGKTVVVETTTVTGVVTIPIQIKAEDKVMADGSEIIIHIQIRLKDKASADGLKILEDLKEVGTREEEETAAIEAIMIHTQAQAAEDKVMAAGLVIRKDIRRRRKEGGSIEVAV